MEMNEYFVSVGISPDMGAEMDTLDALLVGIGAEVLRKHEFIGRFYARLSDEMASSLVEKGYIIEKPNDTFTI